jgi:peptidyl-prolyl cis-trans isomerase SurA
MWYCCAPASEANAIMMPHFVRYPLSFTMSCVAAMLLTFAISARAQTVAVTIYGDPITENDIEQRTKLNFVATHKQTAHQDILNELSGELDVIKKAQMVGVGSTDAEVDRAYLRMCSRMRITPEHLTKSLESQGIHPDTLKQRMKADMARTSLVRVRY